MLPSKHIQNIYKLTHNEYIETHDIIRRNMTKLKKSNHMLELKRLIKIFEHYWWDISKEYYRHAKWNINRETDFTAYITKFLDIVALIKQILFELRIMNFTN